MNNYQVILRPVVTEKSMDQAEWDNQYTFEVALRANKRQIKEAVEALFDVEVTNVRTMVMKGKTRRWGRNFYSKSDWKKAVVTLAEGDSIVEFEGV
ncbi:MAG: 50S ribosomal protein L23 [Anaerolineales bacterium]|nr:50S ribosomal protein L23 [Anaerolineales bacterium]MCB9127197.1 50S ribosomal protein L23 [Ardenticatenales bacterium]MCB9171953.1 50S ribosomal protein L23 [Ardenticatenales bacterium]